MSISAIHGTHQTTEAALSYTIERATDPSLSTSTNALAVILPPLGRLGGSSRDHVVLSLRKTLVEQGWIVLSYDPRGAGKSSGRGSFSGIPEASDFQSILKSVVLPLFSTPSSESNSTAATLSSSPIPVPRLLLAGYSFGSLSITHSLTPSDLLPPDIKLHYLLVSYPLSVRWALTLFNTTSFINGLDDIVRQEKVQFLVVWGDRDQFSAKEKLRNWAESSLKRNRVGGDELGGRIRTEEIVGADHFWVLDGSKERLLEIVKDWLKEEQGSLH